MSYRIFQTRRFARTYKRLQDSQVAAVDKEVLRLAKDPELGQKKRGDLAGLYVHKFTIDGQLYLLGYTKDEVVRLIYSETLGPHESFYRDFKS